VKSFIWLRPDWLSRSWWSAVWSVNGFFLLATVVFAYVPRSSSSQRQGIVQYLAQFTLAEERNLATYWEGWCLLLVSLLAFERFLESNKTVSHERQSWLGLSVLAAGLSIDEFGSIHERARLLFSWWGLSGRMSALIPLALPVFLILTFTLQRMWSVVDRSRFWLTLSAFILFGSVALQEYLEHAVAWPWWALGIRVGIEEGTELIGVFLLLYVAVSAGGHAGKLRSAADLVPRPETLAGLRPVVVFITLSSFVPLGVVSAFVMTDVNHRGTPAAWLPFMLLNLSWMAAWVYARNEGLYAKRLLLVCLLALFFSLDQILVFERITDKNLVRSGLGNLMFPCMAVASLAIPTLRTLPNFIVLGMLLPLNVLLFFPSEFLPWFVLPLQSLGIFWAVTSALPEVGADARRVNRCSVTAPSLRAST